MELEGQTFWIAIKKFYQKILNLCIDVIFLKSPSFFYSEFDYIANWAKQSKEIY